MEKKLVFVTTRLFWPTDSGRKLSLYHYCRGLHERYGYSIYVYSFMESGQSSEMLSDMPDFIKEVRLAKSISIKTKIQNLLMGTLMRGWAFQQALFYSKDNDKEIAAYCSEVNPDIIMVDMIRLAPYITAFDALPAKKILDLDDLLSKRYARQLKSDNQAALMGVYAGGGNKKFASMLDISAIRKFVLSIESKRLQKWEQHYGRLYDHVVFVSELETSYYNKLMGENKAVTVRTGVESKYFASHNVSTKESGAIAYLGNLRYAPNVDSLRWIAENILPKLDFEIKFYVIGTVTDEVKNQFRDFPLIFCGRVEDMRTTIKSCEVFLSPIAHGSGIKTKILEAMAMGMPVVTNSCGAEGIEAEDGIHFFVRDNADDLAECVNRLHRSPEVAAQIGEAAQKLMAEKYDWDIVFDAFEKLGV